MKKFFWSFVIVFLLNLLNWWLPLSSVQAREPLPASVQVSQNTATPHFPENIQFDFKAKLTNAAFNLKKAELSYRLVGDIDTSVRPANFNLSSSRELSASFQVDTRKDYFPPGARLTYYWTLYDTAGTGYSSPTQELTYHDNRFSFRELKSGLVTVRWYQGDANFGQAALNKATSTIEKLSKLYKLEPKTPIILTIYPDSRTMFTALPPNTAEWVGGQATPSLGTIVLSIAPGNLLELGRSIPHEISHQVVYQATLNPYNVPPTWLDEGLAVSNQEQIEAVLLEALARGIDKRNLFSLRALNGSFPADSQESYLAYAQSLKTVQYILSKYGQEALAKILAAFRDGVTYDEAVRRGLGISLDDLDREWKQSIGYLVSAPVLAPAATVTSVSATGSVSATVSVQPTAACLASDPRCASGGQANLLPSTAPTLANQTTSNSQQNFWLPIIGGIGLVGVGLSLSLFAVRRKKAEKDKKV